MVWCGICRCDLEFVTPGHVYLGLLLASSLAVTFVCIYLNLSVVMNSLK